MSASIISLLRYFDSPSWRRQPSKGIEMADAAPPDILVGASVDPIFAAIEAHRAAYGDLSRALAVLGKLPPTDPGYEQANAIAETVDDEVFRSARDLAKIVPTTLAGAVALLEYIHFFNQGGLPESNHELWPYDLGPHQEELETPWPFLVMHNILTRLKQSKISAAS